MRQIRRGIIGCGNIANLFVKSLTKVNSGILCAVASNTPNKTKSFATQYNVDKYYSNYDDLINDKNIDAIYIATPDNFHYKNTKLCIAHNKHVLCEKPLTINAKQIINFPRLEDENFIFEIKHVNEYISTNLTESPVIPLKNYLTHTRKMDTLRE